MGRDAAVVEIDDGGNMRVLRQGTNNFTCVPDIRRPGATTRSAQECDIVDRGMDHSQAAPAGKVGFIYMLQGGSDASNSAPYATEHEPGGKWIDTGPHVMLLNVGDMVRGYPNQKENPDTRQPYVMWSGTPYEHLMIPVG